MSKILQELQELIRRAGKAVEQYAHGVITVKYKDDRSPVTDADMASHRILIDGLSKFGYPILSEEGLDDKNRFGSTWLWLVDPLDGTKDFLEKTGEYSVMIGLLYKHEPVMGMVYHPATDTLYFAEKGCGAYMKKNAEEPRIMHVSQSLNRTTMWVSRHHARLKEQKLAKSLGIRHILPCGSIGLKASFIASGHGQLYVNSGDRCGEWDSCAAEVIISEAGGRISDLEGKKIRYNKELPKNLKGVVITNGELHDKVIEEIRNI